MNDPLSPEAVRKHVHIYIRVFAALAALTVVTVGVSSLHLPLVWAILIALSIASFKSSLVAAFFMHLASEKRIIFWLLLLAIPLFLTLLLMPVFDRF